MSAIAWAPVMGNEEWDEAALEALHWDSGFGREWRTGLVRFLDAAKLNGITLEAASPDLLRSAYANFLGLSPLPLDFVRAEQPLRPPMPPPGAWILRTSPNTKGKADELLDSYAELAPIGRCPTIVLEESNATMLPFLAAWTGRWPGKEAWCRAAILAEGIAHVGNRAKVEPVGSEDFGSLLDALAVGGRDTRTRRAPRSRNGVFVRAVDLLRAAVAWEEDRAAYWRAREAQGFVDGASRRRWIASARRWGLTSRELASPDQTRHTESESRWPDPFPRASRHSGGGKVPFLPHTVIAHDPRRAASLSFVARAKKGKT